MECINKKEEWTISIVMIKEVTEKIFWEEKSAKDLMSCSSYKHVSKEWAKKKKSSFSF